MTDLIRVISTLTEMSGVPADIGAEDLSHKGQPNGYAELDASGWILSTQMQFSVDFWDSII